MKPSEKLKLIREIAEKLAGEDMNIINLTLEQFGVATSRSSKMDPLAYVLRRIQKAEDEVLEELGTHLGVTLPMSSKERPTFWKDGNFRIFISHLAKKKETAAELREALEMFAISAFVAHEDIVPSRQWQFEIELALQSCDALVALMETGFHKSYWTDHEIGFAYGRGLPVIPVGMGEMPYGIIGKIQALKFEDVNKLAETIFRILITDRRTALKMSYALLSRFEKSNTFASSAQNLRLLKKIKVWDEEFIARLKAAPRNNDQIKGSFDVPEGVQAFVKKLMKK